MCGIVGVLHFGASPRDERGDVIRMRDAMAHRGPDDEGLFQTRDRRVTFGHRRLSIVDLSADARQPMSNEDGTVWLTFNGEIYNFRELRRELEDRGHRFHSGTDAEVIVHLYEDAGLDAVPRLDGMFAFGLWDETRRRLVLVRDRLGKKPLYYTVVNGRLLFASEIKALLRHPDVHRDLDLQALDLYLTFSNVPAPLTMFAGIRKLPPAHLLTCDDHGEVAVRRYWSPLDVHWPGHVDEREAVERVRALVQSAVSKRLMSDVPVGCFLSGGLDSSTTVALMSQLMSEPLRTFSVGFEGFGPAERFHDLPHARRVATHFGCDHTEVMVTAADCQQYLPELVREQDEPLGDPACVPMHFGAVAAHKAGIRVVLVGEGSDELFGGYRDMVTILTRSLPRWNRVRRLPRSLRAGLHQASRLLAAPAGRIDVLRRAAQDDPLYWGLDVVFWDSEKDTLLRPEARAPMGAGAAPLVRRMYDELHERHPAADALQQMSYVELSNRLPELLLMRVDKICMARSLEARAPFLDYRLVEYALSLPRSLKIAGRRTKHVLKEAVKPFVPAEIVDRPKQGFSVPLPRWLAHELAPWAESRLRRSPLHRRGFFDLGAIDRLWAAHRSGAADHSFDLWCLLILAAWYEAWIEGPAAA
jgi:asparagine synthase (glutamine-hydrolysing)